MAMWCHQHMLGDYKGRYRAGLWIKNDEKKKKITINCFTPAASWKKKKKVQTKEGDFFLLPCSKSILQNASSTAPFFSRFSDSAGKDLQSRERRHRFLYQLLGKRLQRQPCNYPEAFLSLPPKSKASSLSFHRQGQSLWWHQQESDLDQFLDLGRYVVGGGFCCCFNFFFRF